MPSTPESDLGPFDADAAALYSARWAHARQDGVIPMAVAEMDFPTDPQILHAITRAAARPMLYPVPYTEGPVGETLAAYFRRQHALPVKADNFWLTAGTIATSHALAALWLNPGDEAIHFSPTYQGIVDSITAVGGVARPIRLDPFQDPAWDEDEFRRAVTNRTRFVYLCHPHNPTGYVFGLEELKIIGDIARRHGLRVLSNELSARLNLFDDHVPMQSIAPDITVTLGGATKSHNLAGLGGSFVMTADSVTVAGLRRSCGRRLPPARAIQQEAMRVAYESESPWLVAVKRRLRASQTGVANALEQHLKDVTVFRPRATYFLWLQVCSPADSIAPFVDLAARLRTGFAIEGVPGTAVGGEPHQMRLVHALARRELDIVIGRITGEAWIPKHT
jgi:bifunctional pyridoxal-dependent enzyme with beta-cystathionase and maltose regulon repressor activities